MKINHSKISTNSLAASSVVLVWLSLYSCVAFSIAYQMEQVHQNPPAMVLDDTFSAESEVYSGDNDSQLSNETDTDYDLEPGIQEALESTDFDPGIMIRRMLRKCKKGRHHRQPKKCRRKLEISLRLVNQGQSTGDTQYILVNSANDELTGEIVYLYNPLILQLRQEQVTVAYKLKYVQSVNSKPFELIMNKENLAPHKYRGCVLSKMAQMQCTSFAYGPSYTTGPTGFCCSCSKAPNSTTRQNVQCSTTVDTFHPGVQTSTHCLKFSPLWYSMYALDKPRIHHTVQFKVYSQFVTGHRDTDTFWNIISDSAVILNSEQPQHSSRNDRVIGMYRSKVQPDEQTLLDYNVHKLLMPEPVYTRNHHMPDELQRGHHSYLLVHNDEIKGDGTQCDKIGVSYPAFLSQAQKCEKSPQSCLDNQPRDFYLQDQHKDSAEKNSSHLLGERMNLADLPIIHDNVINDDKLHAVNEKTHVSAINVQINADDIQFMYPGNKLRILQVISFDQANNKTNHKLELSILVMNTGRVTANFTVQLMNCHPLTLLDLSQELLLDPQHSGHAVFPIVVNQQLPEMTVNNTCTVKVINSVHKVVTTLNVWFVLGQRCFCVFRCQCQCGTQKLRCRPTSYDPDIYESQPKYMVEPFLGHLVLCGIGLASLLLLGLIKAVLGATCYPSIGILGFAMCYPDLPFLQPSRTKVFFINIVFIFMMPFLFIFWINWSIALKRNLWQKSSVQRELKKSSSSLMGELEPLIPMKTSSTHLTPLQDTNTTEGQGMKQYEAVEPADVMMEMHKDADVNPTPSDSVITSTTISEPPDISPIIAELTLPGKVVFCNYEAPHPNVPHSGSKFSLCGYLTAESNLFKFSIEFHLTQIYEIRQDKVISMTNLQPLQTEILTEFFAQDEVLERISDKPKYHCLNKVL